MKVIKDLSEIKAASTVNRIPTHNDVRLAFPQYCKGWVTAIYNRETQSWMYGYMETEEETNKQYYMTQMLFKNANISEMYVFYSGNSIKAKWALWYMVTEK